MLHALPVHLPDEYADADRHADEDFDTDADGDEDRHADPDANAASALSAQLPFTRRADGDTGADEAADTLLYGAAGDPDTRPDVSPTGGLPKSPDGARVV
jgi:hypothetical protein